MIKLENSFTLITPKQDNNGVNIPVDDFIKQVSDVAGGATVTDCAGYWLDKGQLYNDNNIKIEMSFSTLQNNDVTSLVVSLVNKLMTVYNQLAVSVETSHGLIIFDTTDSIEDITLALVETLKSKEGSNYDTNKQTQATWGRK